MMSSTLYDESHTLVDNLPFLDASSFRIHGGAACVC